MNKRYFSSKVFQKTFSFYWIILFVPIIIFALGFYRTLEAENLKRMMSLHDLEAKQTSVLIDAKLMEMDSVLNELRNLKWIYKYMAEADIFMDEFTPLNKLEYCRNLERYAGFADFISSVAVVHPGKATVVTADGWYSTEDFLNWMKIKNNIDLTAVLEQLGKRLGLKSTGALDPAYIDQDYLFFCKSLEISQFPRAYAMFRLDKHTLQSSIMRMLGPDTLNMSIVSDHGVALNTNENVNAGHPMAYRLIKASVIPGWRYEYVYRPGYTEAYREGLYTLVVITALSLAAGAIAAYIFSIFSYKPLHNLVNKLLNGSRIALNHRLKDYHLIEMSFDSMRAENTLIKESAEKHRRAVRDSLLTCLLKGYFEGRGNAADLSEKLRTCGISFNDADFYSVCVVHAARGCNKAPDGTWGHTGARELMEAMGNYLSELRQNHVIQALDDEIAVILSFADVPPRRERLREIVSGLRTGGDTPVEITVSEGDISQGFSGIGKSYCSAKSGAVYSSSANDPDPEQRMKDIVAYVDSHYTCSDLSLKELSDRFGMSVSAISKAFKELTGIKFFEYVSGLRMEKAKLLLQSDYYDIKTIAAMVGYDNEYSFKRAFLRYEDVRPRDYAERIPHNS